MPLTDDQLLDQIDAKRKKTDDQLLDEVDKGQKSWLAEIPSAFARDANIGVGEIVKAGATSDAAQTALISDLRHPSNLLHPLKQLGDVINLSRRIPLGQLGQFITQTGEEMTPPKTLAGKTAGMAGGMAPIVASGPMAPAVMGMESGQEGLETTYDAAIKSGASPEDAALKAVKTGLLRGVTEAALWAYLPKPVKGIINSVTGQIGGGAVSRFLIRRAGGAAEGAALGASSQALKNVETGRPAGENVKESALGTGAAMGAMPQPGIEFKQAEVPDLQAGKATPPEPEDEFPESPAEPKVKPLTPQQAQTRLSDSDLLDNFQRVSQAVKNGAGALVKTLEQLQVEMDKRGLKPTQPVPTQPQGDLMVGKPGPVMAPGPVAPLAPVVDPGLAAPIGSQTIPDLAKPTTPEVLSQALDRLPPDIRSQVNIKGIKPDVEFPSTLEGAGALFKNGWIYLEKGEPVTSDTILHEVLHDYVNKHPEMVDDTKMLGMENAVDKIHSSIIEREKNNETNPPQVPVQVPAQEGGAGIQPLPQAPPGEVPLKSPEPVKPKPASKADTILRQRLSELEKIPNPTPAQFREIRNLRNKFAADSGSLTAAQVEALPDDQPMPPSYSASALRYGAGLDPNKPEQLAELQRMRDEAKARLDKIPKETGNFQQIQNVGSRLQWYNEALQAATGQVEGDTVKATLGPDYKAPFPEAKPEPAPAAKPAEEPAAASGPIPHELTKLWDAPQPPPKGPWGVFSDQSMSKRGENPESIWKLWQESSAKVGQDKLIDFINNWEERAGTKHPRTAYNAIMKARRMLVDAQLAEDAAKVGANPERKTPEGAMAEAAEKENSNTEKSNRAVRAAELEAEDAKARKSSLPIGSKVTRTTPQGSVEKGTITVEGARVVVKNAEGRITDYPGNKVKDGEWKLDSSETGDHKLSVNTSGQPPVISKYGKGPVNELIEDYAKPIAAKTKNVAGAVRELFSYYFSPTSRATPEILDIMYKSKGFKEQFLTRAAGAMEEARNHVDALPRDEQIAFIDRIKLGKDQPTPELRQLAALLRKWDDQLYKEAAVYKPDTPYLDNHYRVLWKEIPGSQGKKGTVLEQFMSKKPWRGSQGWKLQHTLSSMSEGISKGGVPVSYNPVDMFMLHAQDMMKFVAANRAWDDLKQSGLSKFVKIGKDAPEGYTRLSDKIAKPFFRSGKVLGKNGEWWVQKDAALLIENYLSTDYLRQGKGAPIGKSLLDLKNVTTAIELGMSPFHAVFVTNESIGSQIALALAKGTERGYSLGDMAKGVATTFQVPREGEAVAKLAKNPEDFKANYPAEYAWMKNKYPDFEGLVNDLFAGGGLVKMHDDYRVQAVKSFIEAKKNDKLIGAVVRAIPALNEKLFGRIFNTYIPHLKLGTWLRDYAFEIQRNGDALRDGTVTRETLARQTWEFTEDRFGELNWDNLYWNRTFKSAMQLAFRSVTWKLGNARGFSKAGKGVYEAYKTTFQAAANKKGVKPHFSIPSGWAMGMFITTALESTILSKVMTGKYPWQLLNDKDEPMNQLAELAKNMTFPRIDKNDPTQRISIPTYWKDMVHAAPMTSQDFRTPLKKPISYVRSSMAGEWGRMADIWENKDFYGNKVFNEDDPIMQKTADQFEHMFPMPFNISSFKAGLESYGTSPKDILSDAVSGRETKAAKTLARTGLGFVGLTKAPYYISHSPAEQTAAEIARGKLPIEGRTKEQAEKSQSEHRTLLAVQRGEMTMDEAFDKGLLDVKRWREFEKVGDETHLQQQIRHFTPEEAVRVWKDADKFEREQIREDIETKIWHSKSLDADEKDKMLEKLK